MKKFVAVFHESVQLCRSSLRFHSHHLPALWKLSWPILLPYVVLSIFTLFSWEQIIVKQILHSTNLLILLFVSIPIITYIKNPSEKFGRKNIRQALALLPTYYFGTFVFSLGLIIRFFLGFFIALVGAGILKGFIPSIPTPVLISIVLIFLLIICIWILRYISKNNFFYFELIFRHTSIRDSLKMSKLLTKNRINQTILSLWPFFAFTIFLTTIEALNEFVLNRIGLPIADAAGLLLRGFLQILVLQFLAIYEFQLYESLGQSEKYKQNISTLKKQRLPNVFFTILLILILCFQIVNYYFIFNRLTNPELVQKNELQNTQMFQNIFGPILGYKNSSINDVEKGIVRVSYDDPAMIEAVQKAQNSLDSFILSLQNPDEYAHDFMIKAKFPVNNTNEYIWIEQLTYNKETDEFTGLLANEPEYVQDLKLGQEVSVKRERVIDWLYFNNDAAVGGYTDDVIKSNMEEEDRRSSDHKPDEKVRNFVRKTAGYLQSRLNDIAKDKGETYVYESPRGFAEIVLDENGEEIRSTEFYHEKTLRASPLVSFVKITDSSEILNKDGKILLLRIFQNEALYSYYYIIQLKETASGFEYLHNEPLWVYSAENELSPESNE